MVKDWSGDAGGLYADLEDLLNENYGILLRSTRCSSAKDIQAGLRL